MQRKFIIKTDGGSRCNPGPAAIGIVICSEKGEHTGYSEYIGIATNNEAEYRAAIFALQKLKTICDEEQAKECLVQLSTDSQLLVEQMNSQFKVKKANIKSLFIELCNLKNYFGQVDFFLIPREENREADRLVNKELDRNNKI